MISITRRDFTLGLGASALALPRMPSPPGSGVNQEPSGQLVTIAIDSDTLDGLPGLVVVDLDDGGRTTDIDLPLVTQLYPVVGSAHAVARVEGGAYVVDPSAGTATRIRARPGTAVDDAEPFAETILIAAERPSGSARFAVFRAGAFPRWLIDLEEATVVDLVAELAEEDPFFQLATFTPGGTELLLATSQLAALVDPTTLRVSWDVTDQPTLSAPQLSPGGGRVGWVWRSAEGRTAALTTASVDGGDAVEELVDESNSLGYAWVDDESVLLWRYPDGDALTLERLVLGSRRPVEVGTIPGVSGFPRVLGNGTRAIVGSGSDDEARWHLIDLERDDIAVVPALDGLTSYGLLDLGTRGVLFGPADLTASEAGAAFVVLNTATGEVSGLVEQVEGQFYPYPTIAPDGRSAVVAMSGPEGDAIWLCDLVGATTVRLDGYLGAVFSPDARFVLTRKIGIENPTEIRSLDGEILRELDAYERAWWLAGEQGKM